MTRLFIPLMLVVALAAPARADFDRGAAAALKGDFAAAFAEFEPLAKQGHAKAQNNLGIMYQYGSGVAKDLAEARRWYRKAAEQGLAQASYNLGLLHSGGEGLPRDYVQAYLWFSLAADGGDGSAPERLERVRAAMTSDQLAEAQRLVRDWRQGHGGARGD